MMTIDDEREGEGGVFWPMMASSQEPQFFGKFLGFFNEFSKIFLKISKSGQKFSTFQGNFYLH